MANANNYPTYEEVNYAPPGQTTQYQAMPQQYQYGQDPNYNQYGQNANYNPNIQASSQKYEELYEENEGTDINKMIRAGFITKVCGILAFQLSITVASIGLVFIPQIEAFFYTSLAANLLLIALFGSIITIIPLACCKSIARRIPINYILLTIFTVCESFLLQCICIQYEPHSVLIAGVLTAAVTITLTLYALKTKSDFTSCGAFLFCMLTILVIGGIISIFWRNYFFETLMSCFGIVLYSIYLIYDIQLISGKFGREYSIEDYIMASMTVYLDIINLFLKILRIIGTRRKS